MLVRPVECECAASAAQGVARKLGNFPRGVLRLWEPPSPLSPSGYHPLAKGSALLYMVRTSFSLPNQYVEEQKVWAGGDKNKPQLNTTLEHHT